MEETTNVIEIKDVSKDYGDFKLDNISFTVPQGSASLREDIGVVFDEMGFHDFLTARQINMIIKNVYKNRKLHMAGDIPACNQQCVPIYSSVFYKQR